MPSSHRRDRYERLRLEFDSLALTFSTGITAVIGLAYWAAAARGYSAEEVGRSAAVINSALMLSTAANLGLGGMYERFLPVSGVRAPVLIARGLSITSIAAVLFSVGFLIVGPTDRLFTSFAEMAMFPVLVAALAAFALLDQVLVGLRRAQRAALKNVVHSVAKLAFAIGLAFTASGWSLVLAWTGPALALVLLYLPWVLRRWSVGERFAGQAQLPSAHELLHYFGATYGIVVLGTIAPLVVPLLVLHSLGAAVNAYFAVAWALVSAVSLLALTVLGPYIAEASATGADIARLTARVTRLLVVITVAGAVLLALVAPFLLQLLGREYSENTRALMQLMAISLPLSVPALVYGGLARITRRLRLAVFLQVFSSVVVVVGVWWTLPRFGLEGIGWTYVFYEAAVALIVAVPLVRILREVRSGTLAGHESATGHTSVTENPALLVSVVMPVRNGALHVREAIDSVLAQRLPAGVSMELVVVDDGSCDATADILADYETEGVRILVGPAQGLPAALNIGIAAARGDLIARMDGDDVAVQGRFAAQIEFLAAHPEVVACGTAYDLCGAASGRVRPPRTAPRCRAHLLFGTPFAHPTVMMRAAPFRAGLRYRSWAQHAEDFQLFSELAQQGDLVNLDVVGLLYRVHPHQVSHVHAATQHATSIAIAQRNLARAGVEVDRATLHRLLRPTDTGDGVLVYASRRLPRLLRTGARGAGWAGLIEAGLVGRERLRTLRRTSTPAHEPVNAGRG